MAVSDIPTPTADFVLSHLNEIQQIQELKNRVVKDLQTQCARYLEQHFSEQKFEIGTQFKHLVWLPSLAIRFCTLEK